MTLHTTRVFRIARNLLAGLVFVVAAILLALYFSMRASLPALEGEHKLARLDAAVSVTRDAQGTVSIHAAQLPDAIRALGFVHGQERFFEMDLARRSAAGELSALLGNATVTMDKDKRRHRMRTRMNAQLQKLPADQRASLAAYTDGVNAGLAALSARPWQYLVLRASPEPWREVDSMLVVSEMYFMLQGRGADDRFKDIRLRKLVGDRLFDWLRPAGGEWDAALDGSAIALPALPTAAEIDVRKTEVNAKTAMAFDADQTEIAEAVGSNNWAVGGALTGHGGAMLADDMHLGLGVPNIWFRTQFHLGAGTSAAKPVAGVSLPGLPSIVVGSNGHVAWGFTNSYGQWFDWVALPKRPGGDASAIVSHRETIAVKGGESVEIEVRETPFGPILHDDATHEYALAWVPYREGGINFRGSDLISARTVDEAALIARESGIPHQNALIADKQGNLAWTIMGRIPDSASAARQSTRGVLTPLAALPTGWLAADRYPLIRNPADARLWTANSRQLAPDKDRGGDLIGDGGFDLGARAMQIRDRLRAQAKFDEKGLYDIQLDRESRFLKRWAELALATAGARANDKTSALAAEIKAWNHRADTDQTGHRIVRAFRLQVMDQLWKSWLAAAAPESSSPTIPPPRAMPGYDGKFEYPVWQTLSARAPHLLPKPHRDWDDFLAAQLAFVYDDLVKQHGDLKSATWGRRNVAAIRHPISRALPFLSRVLDMPAVPLAGDNNMPRVAAPTFGASQRLVVSPGREEQAIFTMPGGQSGHPLSPYFGSGHDDWLNAKTTPLLAGVAQHTLRLVP